MKRAVSFMAAVCLAVCFCACGACGESSVGSYSRILNSSAVWERIDYNATYQKNALSVLPDLIRDTSVFYSASARIFGDDTGEVWVIVNSDVYRMWTTEEGYIVLTSTSDGLGYTGYAVFRPAGGAPAAEEPAEKAPAEESPAEQVPAAEVPADGVMTHDEYTAAELDGEVLIESYVQAHQSWWDNKVTAYLQSEDGAYFVYEMQCSEEDAAKLVPGTKIRVKGYKSEWAGEVEIVDGTFEFVEAEPWLAAAADVTALLGTDRLRDHMNELVSVTGAVVTAQENGEAFSYKNTEEKTDDLYYSVEVDGRIYNFCVEFYLCDRNTDAYRAVESLKVGDTVDLEGFLYWYNGPNLHTTGLTVR